MLTNEQYKSLGVLFENDLKEIARKIIAFYQLTREDKRGPSCLICEIS
jgi:hypothetical protein